MELKTHLSEKQILLSTKLRSKLIFTHKICNFLFNKYRFPWSRKIGRIISKVILPKLTGTIICPTIFNFDLCISENDGSEYYYLGFYEIGTLDIMRNCLKAGDVFVDIGSSVGLMSITASFVVGEKGKVLSFEPDTKRYSDLLNSISTNKRTNIKTYNFGLGSEKKSIKLYKDRCSPSMIKGNNNAFSEIVEIRTIDEVLKIEKVCKVDFVKIDVEGFEIEVLKGAKHLLSQSNAPMLCIECSRITNKNSINFPEAIFDFIKNINNYSVYQLTKTSSTISKLKLISDKKSLHKHDNCYCFLNKHLKILPTSLFIKKYVEGTK
jgi:FkbM family methyltransferase